MTSLNRANVSRMDGPIDTGPVLTLHVKIPAVVVLTDSSDDLAHAVKAGPRADVHHPASNLDGWWVQSGCGFDAAHSASDGVSGKTDEEPKGNPTKAVNDESDGQDLLAVHWVLLRSLYNVTCSLSLVKYFYKLFFYDLTQ